MAETGFPIRVVRGVPVVAAPEQIDIANARELRTALLRAAAHGYGTVVVDLSRTRFCDTAGVHALVGAHNRAQAEGSQVLLVITGAAVLRIFAISGLDRVIPNFADLDEALATAAS